MGRDSSVGKATRCSLDGPGIESRCWRVFRTRPDRTWGPLSLLHNGYRVFPGVERPGRGVDHPPTSSSEVKERVQPYFYFPYGFSWPVLEQTLLYFTLPKCNTESRDWSSCCGQKISSLHIIIDLLLKSLGHAERNLVFIQS